jgi:hypothetical protein
MLSHGGTSLSESATTPLSQVLISVRENTINGLKMPTMSQGCQATSRSARRQLKHATQTLDCDLREKKFKERVVPYTNKIFCQAAIEWLVATDWISQILRVVLSFDANDFTCSRYRPLNTRSLRK